jgi:hypothetical protein
MAQQIVETEEVTTVSDNVPEKVTQTTTHTNEPAVKTGHPQNVYETKKVIFRTYQIVWYILGLIEVLLGFRLALKVLGANPASPFVDLIYTMSNPLALPFSGILRTPSVGASVFEWSTVIAAIVYALIAYGIVRLIHIAKPTTPGEVSANVDNP